MDKKILQEEIPSKREEILSDSCLRSEMLDYFRAFTAEELELKKDEFARKSISLAALEDEKKKEMDSFKSKIKELKNELFMVLGHISTKQRQVRERVYLLDDQDAEKMEYYNALGELVYSRPLNQNERQLRITSFTGTND